ncbi:MAG: lysophospholipid acyltransferase family protein [Helicobacteraceae bacterium]|nr:lysophospholipid acyltransferase family protein [Helicobacteraceae bacterium]
MSKRGKRGFLRNRWVIAIIGWIGYLYVRLIYLLNYKKHSGIKRLDPDKPYIVVFWHEYILLSAFCWRRLRKNKKDRRVFAMISEHNDGEYIARIVKHLGIGATRGSSTRGGVKALLAAIGELKKGNDAAFTPDGPRGPRRSIAEGVIMAAKKSGAEIVPICFKASRSYRLKSWDRFVIPKPFGTITLCAGKPFGLEGLDNDESKQRIRQALEAIEI